jgi:hypothetical protein
MSLEVAIYLPRSGNVCHWTLALTEGSGSSEITTLYEVVGQPTLFSRNTMCNTKPESTSRFERSVWVSDINDIVAAKRILEHQPIHNDVATWGCQDFVLEALEALNEALVIEDYYYDEAKAKLESIYYG